MANICTTSALNFAQPVGFGVTSGTTSHAAFPVDNIGNYMRPRQPWIATGNSSGTTRCFVDYGAATVLTGAYIVCNLDSVILQRSSDASTWTNNTTVNLTQDAGTGLYRAYTDLSAFNYRYLAALSNDSTPNDGSGQMKVAALLGVASWDAGPWATQIGFPFSREVVTPTLEPEQIATGHKYNRLSIASSRLDLAMINTVLKLAGYGATPMLFWLNDGNNSEAWICYVRGQANGYQRPGPNEIQFGQLAMEEIC